MRDIMTYETYRNTRRFERLREYYARAMDPREHTELIHCGEAIRRAWNARAVPKHRALTVIEADDGTRTV